MTPKTYQLTIPINDSVRRIITVLTENSDDVCYVVGGHIRDYLYCLFHDYSGDPIPNSDQDLTTNLDESEIIARLNRVGIKTKEKESVDTFGVVFACIDDTIVEIAPFRRDIGSDGRRPNSVEKGSMYEDSCRRDFTMNAIYYDVKTSTIYDFHNGITDIRDSQVRVIGKPFDRFNEDKLRVLRLARFIARFSDSYIVDDATFNAINHFRDLRSFAGVSSERINDEFLKGIKQSKQTSSYIRGLEFFGLLSTVFQHENLTISRGYSVINSKNTAVVLALMLRDSFTYDGIRNGLHDLKYSSEICDTVTKLVKLTHFDVNNIYHMIKCASGLSREITEIYPYLKDANSRRLMHLATYVPPKIDGNELLTQGYIGKQVGEKIAELTVNHYLESWSTFNV